MSLRSAALAGLLVVVILAALGRLGWYYARRPRPGEPVAALLPVACAACGRAYADRVGRQPAECRFCGAAAVWRAEQCRECGVVFPLVRAAGPGGATRCPRCGSRRVGEVRPDAVSEP